MDKITLSDGEVKTALRDYIHKFLDVEGALSRPMKITPITSVSRGLTVKVILGNTHATD